jgi:sugar phosphate isomerase/epimerase
MSSEGLAMHWRLSGFTDEAGKAIDDQIQATRQAGLTHLDLRGFEGHSIVTLPEDKARAIREKLDKAGMTVNMFGSPIGKIDIADDFAGDQQKLEHLAKMAEVFDCTDVRVFSYFNQHGADYETWRDASVDRLSQLRDQAGRLGLRLWLENEMRIFGDHLAEFRLLAEQLRDGERFCCLFDFDNFTQTGDDCWTNWQALKPYIDGFHFKECTADGTHVPIDEGASHAEAIMADALASGWSGPISLEPHLAHSEAVMATGPHGQQNQALSDLTTVEAYVYAADRAKAMLTRIGAEFK